MASSPKPPLLARALAHVLLRGEAREVVIGDLDQEFAEAIANHTPKGAARRRYWRQAIASVLAVRKPSGDVVTARSASRLWQGLSLDARSVVRALRRSPGYAAVAVLSLAIGIGANTAIVSVVRQLLLEPMPVERPEHIKLVYWRPPSSRYSTNNLNATGFTDAAGVKYRSNYTYPEFAAMNAAMAGESPFAGYNVLRRLTVAAGNRPPLLSGGLIVTGTFFDTLRPRMAMGRGINNADDQPGAPLVAVISHKLWTSYFGAESSILGETLTIGDSPATIIGVTAAGYRGLSPGGFSDDDDVTVPFAAQPLVAPEWNQDAASLVTSSELHWVRAIARVTPDKEQAVAGKLTAAFRGAAGGSRLTPEQIAESAPALLAAPRGADSLRLSTAQPLRLLSIVVAVVLLIACTNVAGLMLARGVSRQRELSVRRALGAGRLRLIRELLVESLLLSLTGGGGGLLLAFWSAPALQAMLTSGLGAQSVAIVLDWPTLAITFSIAVGTGIIAGLIPAIRLSGRRSTAINSRGQAGAPKLLIGRALLAAQIAVSLPLVAGAGLLLRTLHNLGSIELGFNPKNLMLFDVDPTMNGRVVERGRAIYPRLLSRLEDMPGVASATYVENALISGFQSDTTVMTGDGRPVELLINRVGPHYLETMGIRLVAGRGIDARDREEAPPAGVLNETAARTLFGDAPALGRRITIRSRSFEVVGVFADVKYQGLKTDVAPTLLQSYAQSAFYSQHVIVRTALSAAEFRQQLPSVLHDVDPNLPFTAFKTQVEQINETIGKERIFTQLLTVFGGFALLLACIGLHGVTSYAVTRRTGEIGIRLALGAQRGQVLWMILRQVLVLAIAGTSIGLPAAWLAGSAIKSLVYGLGPTDKVTLIGAAIVMIGVALAAGWWPARRAARMEALAALRIE